MSSFVSAVIAGRSPLWTPRVEVALEPLQSVGQEEPSGSDQEQPGEDLRALERAARDHHHPADPVLRGDVLRDDDADERVADAKPQPGEDEWHRPRQRDRAEDLAIARSE